MVLFKRSQDRTSIANFLLRATVRPSVSGSSNSLLRMLPSIAERSERSGGGSSSDPSDGRSSEEASGPSWDHRLTVIRSAGIERFVLMVDSEGGIRRHIEMALVGKPITVPVRLVRIRSIGMNRGRRRWSATLSRTVLRGVSPGKRANIFMTLVGWVRLFVM